MSVSLIQVVGTLIDPEKLRGTPYEQYCSRHSRCIDPECVNWNCPRRCTEQHKKGRSHCGHRSQLYVSKRVEVAEETIDKLRPYSSPLIDEKECLFGRFHSVDGDPQADEIEYDVAHVKKEIQAALSLSSDEVYVRKWSVFAVLPSGYAIEEDEEEDDGEDDSEADSEADEDEDDEAELEDSEADEDSEAEDEWTDDGEDDGEAEEEEAAPRRRG